MTQSRTPHRHPRYLAFIITGAVVGVILATGLALLSDMRLDPSHATYSLSRVVMYFGVLGAGLGSLLGAAVALLLDRRG